MSKRILGKKILGIAFVAVVSFFVSASLLACGEEETDVPQMDMSVASPKTQPIVQVEQFKAPDNSVVSPEKAKLYVKASAALVELGVRWSERIDKAPDTEKIQILNAYNVARDQLCARVGLAGIAEYNWITSVALSDPKNKAAFESAGLRSAN
ncbi:MAG: hypothetical protein HUK20_01870 [Fibrobacter sp.]|nr:hypothetical protein [Fibrobacter sp.]